MRLQEQADSVVLMEDDDDPAAELSALYLRALELVRGDFEEKTWSAFWRNVVHGQTSVDTSNPATDRHRKTGHHDL